MRKFVALTDKAREGRSLFFVTTDDSKKLEHFAFSDAVERERRSGRNHLLLVLLKNRRVRKVL